MGGSGESAAINRLVALALQAGLHSDDGQWSEAFVHYFCRPMPDDIRTAGGTDATLAYFMTKRTPHNPEYEGFIDRNSKVAITFETGSR